MIVVDFVHDIVLSAAFYFLYLLDMGLITGWEDEETPDVQTNNIIQLAYLISNVELLC